MPPLISYSPSLESEYSATASPSTLTLTYAPSSRIASMIKYTAKLTTRSVVISEMAKIACFLLLKVRSAEEVALVNTLDGARLTALAAVDTFFVIDKCKIISYGNSSCWAGLFAFSASDTAVLAIKSYPRAFIMVVAGYGNSSCVTNNVDYALRAFLDAKTAANAFLGVDSRDTLVVFVVSVAGADLYTVAVAEAGKRAEVVARVENRSGFAGFRTVVVILLFFRKAKTVAGYVCNLLDNIAGFKA